MELTVFIKVFLYFLCGLLWIILSQRVTNMQYSLKEGLFTLLLWPLVIFLIAVFIIGAMVVACRRAIKNQSDFIEELEKIADSIEDNW